MTRREWQVPPAAAGERLDRYLAGELDEPRNQIQRWIRAGRVRLNGASTKASAVLAGGEHLACDPPSPSDRPLVAEPGELVILYADDDLLVLDKPAGLSVHPGAGRPAGTLVNRLLDRFPEIAEVGGPGRPGIVHRLDLDTTGVMVVARSVAAYRQLSQDFAGHQVDKRYLAVSYGVPAPATGTIDAPIGRHPRERKKMTVRADGRPALTHYRTLATYGRELALLELDLRTGRTHQIRVHLKDLGHPLVGDPVYGEARWKALPATRRSPVRSFARPALHAWRLGLVHPISGEAVAFVAPPAADLQALWQAVSGDELPLPAPSGD